MGLQSYTINKWKSIILILLFNVFYVILASSSSKAGKYRISEVCGGGNKKPNSRIIEGALLVSEGERNVDCAWTFQTDTILQRFMLRFEKLQLDCNDHLVIYDGAYTTSPHKANLSCMNTLQNVGTIYTHSNHVTLKYSTDQWGPETNGFRLIVTAFKYKQNTCLHFRCQKTNFCIHTDLTCDEVNHCGDGSDESPSLAMCPTAPLEEILGVSRTFLVFGAATLAALGCIFSVVVVGCICRKTRRRRHPNFSHDLHNDSSYQMDIEPSFGRNGSFGSMVSEKPPAYPGGPQHTIVLPPNDTSGNRLRPTPERGYSTRWGLPLTLPTEHCARRLG